MPGFDLTAVAETDAADDETAVAENDAADDETAVAEKDAASRRYNFEIKHTTVLG